MKWSGLFSKIQRASALSVASGVVAATLSDWPNQRITTIRVFLLDR